MDKNLKKALDLAVVIIENRLIGKVTPYLMAKTYSLKEIADVFSKATGRSFTRQRIMQLYDKYSRKGGEKND